MSQMNNYRNMVDDFLLHLSQKPIFPKLYRDAMFYTVLNPGKRIRALLVLTTASMFSDDIACAVPAAAAIELIHAYSLIHDDLPAMDNDDLRRGKPANHKIFGEDMAILAGDGLNTYSFSVIANSDLSDRKKIKIISILSKYAGIYGMAVGQAADVLYSTNRLKCNDKKLVNFIHKNKTARLIQASVIIGGICADAKDDVLEKLSKYGLYIGLSFQIIDDCLDIVGDEKKMGKKKVDSINNTLTYPKVYGLERSYEMAERLHNNAIREINGLNGGEKLVKLAKIMVERDK